MLTPMVERTDIVDDHTVNVRLKFATPIFLPALASAWCRIVPKHILERDGDLTQPKSIIGTGPFKFLRYVRGNVIEWECNPNYYNPKLPYLDGANSSFSLSVPPRWRQRNRGRFCCGTSGHRCVRGERRKLDRRGGIRQMCSSGPSEPSAWCTCITGSPLSTTPRSDAPCIWPSTAQEIFGGAVKGGGTPCVILDPQLFPEYALPMEEVQQGLGCRQAKEQDIADAKRLIEQHAPGGFDLNVVVRALGPFYTDPAQLMVQQLRRIGVRGTMRTMESAAGFAASARGDFHFIGGQATQINSLDVYDPSSFIAPCNKRS